MKKKNFASVVYDRRGDAPKRGISKVEIYIYLGMGQKKYIALRDCTPMEWKKYQKSPDLAQQLKEYEAIVVGMLQRGEPMTIEQLDMRLGNTPRETKEKRERKAILSDPNGFIVFIKERMSGEHLHANTVRRYLVVIDSLIRFGRLCRFTDLTDKNVKAYDDFMRKENSSRTDVAMNNYHKIIKKYARLAYQMDYIPKNPYESPLCKFKRGKCQERRPLLEDELLRIRELEDLPKKEERARDLFVFSAYTGLAYSDTQTFNFKTMAEELDGNFYIDGRRTKNGHAFYTPILPPAMAVLKKYDYHLPIISNQKFNDYLHLIEARANLNKPMTSHVARHSFATLMLSYDIPLENISRMLGHTNSNTTRIYAKILKTTIERHTQTLLDSIK